MDLTEFTRQADRAWRVTTGRIEEPRPTIDWGQLVDAFEQIFDTLVDALRAFAEAVLAFIESVRTALRESPRPAFPGVEQNFVRLGRGHQRGMR